MITNPAELNNTAETNKTSLVQQHNLEWCMDPHEGASPVHIEGVWLQNKTYEQAVPAEEKLWQATAPKAQIKNKHQNISQRCTCRNHREHTFVGI